jgi:hypothetical protein
MRFVEDDDIGKFNFRNMTLHDALGMIIPDDARFPKDQRIAKLLFLAIMAKFNSCTEAEKRDTTRSDAEFMLIMKETIMKRCGFKNEIDAYGEDWENVIKIPEIPIIKRGNELIWSPVADPEEHPAESDPELDDVMKKLKGLGSMVCEILAEYYPTEYSKTFAIMRYGKCVLNTSHTELIKQLRNTRNLPLEFMKVAVPLQVNAAVDYIADNCSMKPKEVKEMYETIVEVLNSILIPVLEKRQRKITKKRRIEEVK